MMMTDSYIHLLTAALLVMVVVLAIVCLWQWCAMRRKNRTLARLIKENLGYKYPRTVLGTEGCG